MIINAAIRFCGSSVNSPRASTLDPTMLSVVIGSWNVATKSPTTDSINLSLWLEKSLSPAPELIILGFQELLPQLNLALKAGSQDCWWVHSVRKGPTIDGLEAWFHLARDALAMIHGQGVLLLIKELRIIPCIWVEGWEWALLSSSSKVRYSLLIKVLVFNRGNHYLIQAL